MVVICPQSHEGLVESVSQTEAESWESFALKGDIFFHECTELKHLYCNVSKLFTPQKTFFLKQPLNLVRDSAVWDLFWPTSIKSGVFDSCSLNSKDVRAHSECFDIWRLTARCWTLQRLTCRPHQLTRCVLGCAGLNGRRRGSLEWGDRGSMRIECIIKWGCHSWEAKRLPAQEHEV